MLSYDLLWKVNSAGAPQSQGLGISGAITDLQRDLWGRHRGLSISTAVLAIEGRQEKQGPLIF